MAAALSILAVARLAAPETAPAVHRPFWFILNFLLFLVSTLL